MGKKYFLAALALVAAVALVSGCVQSGAQDAQNQNAPATGAGEEASTAGQVKELNITAMKFSFEPAVMTVNVGDRVRLNITVPADDTAHGFNLPEFGVRADLPAGKTTTVEFTASKAGTFDFSCDVYCGEGHSDMKGTLLVK